MLVAVNWTSLTIAFRFRCHCIHLYNMCFAAKGCCTSSRDAGLLCVISNAVGASKCMYRELHSWQCLRMFWCTQRCEVLPALRGRQEQARLLLILALSHSQYCLPQRHVNHERPASSPAHSDTWGRQRFMIFQAASIDVLLTYFSHCYGPAGKGFPENKI